MSPRSCCAKFSLLRDFAPREQSDTRKQRDTGDRSVPFPWDGRLRQPGRLMGQNLHQGGFL